MLEDAKVHVRHRSISLEARDYGSIDHTDGDRVVERRSGAVRGTATSLCMSSMARNYGHEVELALETDSVSARNF